MASAGHRWSATIPSASTPRGLQTDRTTDPALLARGHAVTFGAVRAWQHKPTLGVIFRVHSPPGGTDSMSGTAGAALPTAVLGFGLDVGAPWTSVRRSRALVQTYLLGGSAAPPPTAAGSRAAKPPLRLPSLVAAARGPRRGSSTARLSLSEPSLLTPNESVPVEGLSGRRRSSVLQKRPPPPPLFIPPPPPPPSVSNSSTLLPCNPPGPSRPAFIHFSQAIQPGCKPRPLRQHSHNPALSSEVAHGDLRPSAAPRRTPSSQGESLFVVGKPCFLSCGQRPAAAATGPARTQLHVFLPSEAAEEEADRESVDEGFMDELDTKITSLKLQQGAPKTVPYHS